MGSVAHRRLGYDQGTGPKTLRQAPRHTPHQLEHELLSAAAVAGKLIDARPVDGGPVGNIDPDSPYAWVRKGQGLPVKAP